MALTDDLPNGSRIALDTMVFIYFVERHQRYFPILDRVITRITSEELEAHASVLSLAEVLVLPITRRDDALVSQYRDLLTSSELNLHPVDLRIASIAAEIRAVDLESNERQDQAIRVADSLIAATAIASNCDLLITNDRKLRRIQSNVRIALLDDFA